MNACIEQVTRKTTPPIAASDLSLDRVKRLVQISSRLRDSDILTARVLVNRLSYEDRDLAARLGEVAKLRCSPDTRRALVSAAVLDARGDGVVDELERRLAG